MFRSRRRGVIFTQHEHARLAGEIAFTWRRDAIRVPFNSFVDGVALHDRGYDVVDVDEIGATAPERWIEIQRRGVFERRGDDAVVDLVVGLHVRRLVGNRAERAAFAAELDALLPELHGAAGVTKEAARTSDAVTDFCDRASFDFCLEEPASGEVAGISYAVDGRGAIALHPWPLVVPRLGGLLVGYRAEGYPVRLEPVVVSYEVVPAATS